MKDSVTGMAFSMHGEIRVAYCILVVNLKGRHIWETGTYWGVRWGSGNANINFSEIGYNISDWIHLALERVQWCAK
jgi:hypothetical protein